MSDDLYTGWAPERWETPVSDVPDLFFESLLHDGALQITVGTADGQRWRLTFADAPGYLHLLEEYRLALWGRLQGAPPAGNTWHVPASPWLARLRHEEPLLDVHHEGLRHFVVLTLSGVIDVLSTHEAAVVALEPGGASGADA